MAQILSGAPIGEQVRAVIADLEAQTLFLACLLGHAINNFGPLERGLPSCVYRLGSAPGSKWQRSNGTTWSDHDVTFPFTVDPVSGSENKTA